MRACAVVISEVRSETRHAKTQGAAARLAPPAPWVRCPGGGMGSLRAPGGRERGIHSLEEGSWAEVQA